MDTKDHVPGCARLVLTLLAKDSTQTEPQSDTEFATGSQSDAVAASRIAAPFRALAPLAELDGPARSTARAFAAHPRRHK